MTDFVDRPGAALVVGGSGGLGLAIASELAGRMSGRLVAESQPGTTTFTLVLPA